MGQDRDVCMNVRTPFSLDKCLCTGVCVLVEGFDSYGSCVPSITSGLISFSSLWVELVKDRYLQLKGEIFNPYTYFITRILETVSRIV